MITPLKLELEYDIASSSLGFADLGTTEPIRNKYNPRAIHMLVNLNILSECYTKEENFLLYEDLAVHFESK